MHTKFGKIQRKTKTDRAENVERNSNRRSVAFPKTPLKCSLPNARRARTTRPADTQQSRPNPQFSFDSKTCGLRKVRLRENPETFDTSRGRAAPPEIRDDVHKKKPAPRTTVLTPPTLAGPIAGEMGFKVEAYFKYHFERHSKKKQFSNAYTMENNSKAICKRFLNGIFFQ